MNASRPFFPAAVKAPMVLLVLAGGVLLSGCAASDTRIDSASPVAADVAKLTRQPGKFPTFASIPNAPTDVRPAAQYGRAAERVVAAGNALVAATEPSTWTLQNSEAFAEKARQDAGPSLEPPKPGEAEAFAREQRERATPPPPRP